MRLVLLSILTGVIVISAGFSFAQERSAGDDNGYGTASSEYSYHESDSIKIRIRTLTNTAKTDATATRAKITTMPVAQPAAVRMHALHVIRSPSANLAARDDVNFLIYLG